MPTQAVMAATSTKKVLDARNARMTTAGENSVLIVRDSIAETVRNVLIAATAPTVRVSRPGKREARASNSAATVRASTPTRVVARASSAPIVRASTPTKAMARVPSSSAATVRASIPTRRVAWVPASSAVTVRASTPTKVVARASSAPTVRASRPDRRAAKAASNAAIARASTPTNRAAATASPVTATKAAMASSSAPTARALRTTPIRLNKFLANAGICSRREADEFIQAGVVSVNGQVVTELGTKIKRSDEVKFHDQPVSIERKVYILLNKPKDTVTTSDDPQARRTVMDLVKNACPERIYPVGRLDRNTTGVLLLTNDGDLASKLTHPKYLKKKIYHVHLDKDLTRADMDQIVQGIQLDDGEIHADAISYTNEEKKNDVGIEIHSGRNRIVRRIFESLGYKVVKLDRVYFAGLTKKGLRRGEWRFLTEAEVNYLRMGAFE